MKKRTFWIRLAAVALLAAIAWAMTIIGRGHTVYLDNKTLEQNGQTYTPPYKVEVYVDGERVAKLYAKERGSTTCIGQKLTVDLVITQEKGGEETTSRHTIAIPRDLDGVVINLPGYLAGLPQSDYLTEFVSLATTEEVEETVSDDFGLDGMDLGGDFSE